MGGPWWLDALDEFYHMKWCVSIHIMYINKYIFRYIQIISVAIIYPNASIALEIIGPPKNRDLP